MSIESKNSIDPNKSEDNEIPSEEVVPDESAQSEKKETDGLTLEHGPTFAASVEFPNDSPEEPHPEESIEEAPSLVEGEQDEDSPHEEEPSVEKELSDDEEYSSVDMPTDGNIPEHPADEMTVEQMTAEAEPSPAAWSKKRLSFLAAGHFLRERGLDICCAALFFLLCGGMIFTFIGWLENTVVYGLEVEMEYQDETCAAENRIFEEYIPHVNVTVNEGKENTMVNTPVVTVGEVLASLGIYLDDNDEVVPALDKMITEDLIIMVSKIDEVEIVMDEVIRHEEQIEYIQTIPIGERQIVQNGSDGLSRRVLRQIYSNGVLQSETIVREEIVTKPVKQIVQVGKGGQFTAPNGTVYSFNYYVDVEATAYGGEMFSGLTFTGKQIELGDIAVDPEVIPLGSTVYVMGDEHDGQFEDIGICSAQDTGRLIVGEKIDVYMGDDLDLCRLFGRRPMRVYVMEIGTWERFG